MRISETSILNEAQMEHLFNLWNAEYPARITFERVSNFETYLEIQEAITHFLLTDDHDHIMGWSYSFNRENERWFGIIVSEGWKGKGYGTLLLNKLKAVEPELNGWVIDHESDTKRNGKPYLSPLRFYTSNGFKVLPKLRLELREISAVKIHWKK